MVLGAGAYLGAGVAGVAGVESGENRRKRPNLGVKRQNAGVEIQKYSKFVSNS